MVNDSLNLYLILINMSGSIENVLMKQLKRLLEAHAQLKRLLEPEGLRRWRASTTTCIHITWLKGSILQTT